MYKRTVKKKVDRRGRGRIQPVTFDEIKEVDEDKIEDPLHDKKCSDTVTWSNPKSHVLSNQICVGLMFLCVVPNALLLVYPVLRCGSSVVCLVPISYVWSDGHTRCGLMLLFWYCLI